MLNVPAFVPLNVTVPFSPPTYTVTLVGFAVIVVAFTVMLIVISLFPLLSFATKLVVPADFGVIVIVLPLILAVAYV